MHVTAYSYAIIQWYSVLAYLQYTMILSGILLKELGCFTSMVFSLRPFAVEIWTKSPSDITA